MQAAVVEKGTVEEIFDNPAHPYTIGLMASKPVVGKKVDKLYSIPGKVPNPVNMPEYCYFKDRCNMCIKRCNGVYPEEISLSPSDTQGSCYRYYGKGEMTMAEKMIPGTILTSEIRPAVYSDGQSSEEVFPHQGRYDVPDCGTCQGRGRCHLQPETRHHDGSGRRVRLRKDHDRRTILRLYGDKTGGQVLFNGKEVYDLPRRDARSAHQDADHFPGSVFQSCPRACR